MTFSRKLFFSSDYRNESSNYQLVTLPNFAKFHPQTTEKLSAFRRKRSNFNTMTSLSLTSVKISEFSLACGIDLA